jgi:tetratricopeptide (TPR) repeat protein
LKRTTIVQVLLAIAVVAPGLALGAVHPQALAALTGLAAALLIALAFGAGDDEHRIDFDFVTALLVGLAAFTALQLVPLPAGLVAIVSPNAHEIRSRALVALGRGGPALMPLTLDASLTASELAKLLVYLAVYLGARLVSRRRGPEFVYGLAVFAAGAAAAVFLAHKILLLDKVYGFYEPLHLGPGAASASAPLLNPNHLSALLGMGAAVAIGQALSIRERSQRVAHVCVAALIGGAVFLTLSRGGMAAFVAGQIIFVALRALARATGKRGGAEHGAGMAWLPLGLAISLGLALFAAQDAILGELANRDASKLDVVREALPLAASFPATGVGRGAFWVGFSLVSDWSARATYTHAENAVVQLVADWGILVGGIALVGFAVVVSRRLLRPPERARNAAAVAALTAFGIHNLVDFNSEIPGVAVVAVALLGALLGAEGSRSEIGARRAAAGRLAMPGWAVLGLATAALAASLGVAVYVARAELDSEERGLRAALGRGDAGAFAPAAMAPILERHPAAWYPPFLAGVARYNARKESPLPLLGRALELNPAAAPAHFYVGRALLRTGRVDQALLELRLASRFDPALAAPAARILVRAIPAFDRLRGIAITDADRRTLWPELAGAFAADGNDAEAERADLALIAMRPPERRSVARHAMRLLGRKAFDEASALVGRLDGPDDGSVRAGLEAEIALAAGLPKRAVAALEKATAAHPGDAGLLGSLARARQAAGDLPGALDAVATLKRLATGDGAFASALVLEASLKLSAGRVQEALAALRQAHQVSPVDAGILRRIAEIAEAQGDIARALDALERLEDLEPKNPVWRERIEKLKLSLELEREQKRRGLSAAQTLEPAGPRR